MFNKNVLAILFSAVLLALSTGANAKVCNAGVTDASGQSVAGQDLCKGDGVTLSGEAVGAGDAEDAPDVDIVEVDLTPG